MKKIDPFPGVLEQRFVERPFMTKTGKNGCQRMKAFVLTYEQQAWLCKWFPEIENARLMEASGMSHSTLHRLARDLGLTKSEKGIRGIKKRQAAHIRKVCERNGYYDSLRGRKTSEACRMATAQMWQEIRDGKREHPIIAMRHRNPRKYKRCMQRKSEARKETIRKETRRVLYGLERQTKLRCIVMYKYTRRQTAHRYNALKRGYIIMEDCSEQGGERYNIYYDEQTERTALFEDNLRKDGFSVLQWKD